MQISIINDCYDQNAKLRQISRVSSIFQNASTNSFSVDSELEAAGFLVDALDSFEGREGVILVNVAPRNGSAKKWKNGTPFGYFWYENTLVVSSVDGLVLSLCKKLGIIEEFYLFDIEEVMNFISDTELSPEEKDRIINTQFRSMNFLPRVADWIWRKYDLPKHKYELGEIQDAPNAVWFIDNFGNIKTTLLREEVSVQDGEELNIKINDNELVVNFYEKLRDLPDESLGVIDGSSGIENKRFLEINLQGASAAEKLKVKIGDSVEI
jgi:hypothetical protein